MAKILLMISNQKLDFILSASSCSDKLVGHIYHGCILKYWKHNMFGFKNGVTTPIHLQMKTIKLNKGT